MRSCATAGRTSCSGTSSRRSGAPRPAAAPSPVLSPPPQPPCAPQSSIISRAAARCASQSRGSGLRASRQGGRMVSRSTDRPTSHRRKSAKRMHFWSGSPGGRGPHAQRATRLAEALTLLHLGLLHVALKVRERRRRRVVDRRPHVSDLGLVDGLCAVLQGRREMRHRPQTERRELSAAGNSVLDIFDSR